jgi:hypothetical protein
MESELTQSWKRAIQGVAHQSLVQLDPVVLEKIKMLKTIGHRTTSDEEYNYVWFIELEIQSACA